MKVISLDASALAIKAGTVKAANVVLLGAAAKFLGFDEDSWYGIIKDTVPEKFIAVNEAAFKLGYETEGKAE